ncbi:MAG: response regulator, partial [Oscillospiraceae bacterium]|nr:response regulator [Oscillospiraceae bacterium]
MKRVLIIDDEKNIADILEYNLKKEGYEATVTKDGETGLFFALSGKYDIVLLDIMLPEMDG